MAFVVWRGPGHVRNRSFRFFLNSFMFQLWGMSVLKTGFGLTPGPLIAAVTSARLGGMADRIGHRWIVSIGCWVVAAGYLWILLTFTSEQDVLVYLPSAVLIGVGVTIAGYQSAAMAEVGVDQFASAMPRSAPLLRH